MSANTTEYGYKREPFRKEKSRYPTMNETKNPTVKIRSKTNTDGTMPDLGQYGQAREIGDRIAALVDAVRIWPALFEATGVQHRLFYIFTAANGKIADDEFCDKLISAAVGSSSTEIVYSIKDADGGRRINHPLHVQINFWPGEKSTMTGTLQFWFDDSGCIYRNQFDLVKTTSEADKEL